MSSLKKFRTEKDIIIDVEKVRIVDAKGIQRGTGNQQECYSVPTSAEFAAGVTKLTPLEQQLVSLRSKIPRNIILLVNCGYKVKVFGRDSRVIARRCGIMCITSSPPFEYSSFPIQRVEHYASMLVRMGYHVGIVDQVESGAAREASKGDCAKGIFQRSLTHVLTIGTCFSFSGLLRDMGSSVASTGEGKDRQDAGDEDEDGSDPTNVVNSRHSLSEMGQSYFILFLREGSVTQDKSDLPTTHSHSTYYETVSDSYKEERFLEIMLVSVIANIIIEKKEVAVYDSGQNHSHKDEQDYPDNLSELVNETIMFYQPVEVVCGEAPSAGLLRTLERCMPQSINIEGPTVVGHEDDGRSVQLVVLEEVSRGIALSDGYGAYLCESSLYNSVISASREDDNNLENCSTIMTSLNPSTSAAVPTTNISNDIFRDRINSVAELGRVYLSYLSSAHVLKTATIQPFLFRFPSAMSLPSSSLHALEVFYGSYRHKNCHSSLFSILNRCLTTAGSRLLKSWVAAPLCNLSDIKERHKAIDEISGGSCTSPCSIDRSVLKGLLQKAQGMDLQGTLSRLSAGRCTYKEYRTFLLRVQALQEAGIPIILEYTKGIPDSIDGCGDHMTNSKLVEEALTHFLDVTFSEMLNREISVFARVGVETLEGSLLAELYRLEALDSSPSELQSPFFFDKLKEPSNAIQEADNQLDKALKKAQCTLKLPKLQYKTVAGVSYLLEVPDSSDMMVPGRGKRKGRESQENDDDTDGEWTVVSRVKGFTRYRTANISYWSAYRIAANERLTAASLNAFKVHQIDHYCEQSDSSVPCHSYRLILSRIVHGLALLDALLSLSYFCHLPGFCRPTLIPFSVPSNQIGNDDEVNKAPLLVLKGLAHPVHLVGANALSVNSHPYVPCDVIFGDDSNETSGSKGSTRAWLLTGPNMGGKSALMRSVGLAAVMAQIGCHVPCKESATLPIFTSILTRMGAQDELMEGSSTFMYEMKETRDICLKPDIATSLVLMDELGRGTSSFDGLAVADATLHHLLHSGCYMLFVTHYHLLAEHFLHKPDKRLQLKFMSYEFCGHRDEIEMPNLNEDHACITGDRNIIFLYQPVDGVVPSSFGVEVASTARLPSRVLQHASAKSIESERYMRLRRATQLLQKLLTL